MGTHCNQNVKRQLVTPSPIHPLTPSPRHPVTPSSPRRGFTLVEMLTVIVIIGILAGLITAVALHARASVKVSAVRMEIGNMQTALDAYKLKYGDYPPDFTDHNGRAPALAERLPAILRVPAHGTSGPLGDLRCRCQGRLSQFHRPHQLRSCLLPSSSGSAGFRRRLPLRDRPWVPAGFNADKQHPFTPGTSRDGTPFFAFTADRLPPWPSTTTPHPLGYTPPGMEQSPAPYVYFHARNDSVAGGSSRLEYGVTNASGTFMPFSYNDATTGLCVRVHERNGQRRLRHPGHAPPLGRQ